MRDAADRLAAEIETQPPDAFAAAVQAEAITRLDAFAAGVRRYRQSPAPDRPAAPPAVWRRGSARLLDYGADLPADAPAILCVPSLINPARILDLTKKRSLMRALSGRGLRPLLVDWGVPDETERNFGLADYIVGHLGAALDHVLADTGRRPALLGYCMGGNLALGLAACRPAEIGAMALLATPWDFHAGYAAHRAALAVMRPGLEMMIAGHGVLPVDLIQALFNGLNPGLAGAKFRALANANPATEKFRRFVALEDWLNDGAPLAGPVARECLFQWYLENTPGNGAWAVNGAAVDPAALDHPALVIVPDDDYIVAPESARPLAGLLPKAKLRTVKAGHIGMIVGGGAKSVLYTPLADWFAGRAV